MNLSNRVFSLAFLLVSFSISIIRAQGGGPPMLTDDSGSPERGGWEMNFAVIYEGNTESNTIEAPIIDLNYGLRDNIQLNYEMTWIREKGQPLANTLDNITLAVKYRFLDEEKDGLSLSFYPHAIFSFNPETVKDKTLSVGFELPVAVGTIVSGIGVNGQLGYGYLAGTAHWFYGVVVSREVSESLMMLAELHGEVERIAEDEPFLNQGNFVNFGAQIKLTEMFSFLGAIGRGLTQGEFGVNYYGYAALQVKFVRGV